MSAAFTVAPRAAFMFMPSFARPLPIVPYFETMVPRTGHENFVLRYFDTLVLLFVVVFVYFEEYRLFCVEEAALVDEVTGF